MNAYKKRPMRKPHHRSSAPDKAQPASKLPVAKVLEMLAPSIEAYLKKKADSQVKMAESDAKIAESVSRLTNFLISEQPTVSVRIHSGTLRKKNKRSQDDHHQRVKKIILRMRKNMKTYEEIARYLEAQNIPTFTRHGRWHAQTVHRLYQDYPES